MFNIFSHQGNENKKWLCDSILHLSEWLRLKNKNKTHHQQQNTWGKGNTPLLLLWLQTSIDTLKSIWWFLRKLRINLPQGPAIPFLSMYPKDTPSYHKAICLTMFMMALFITARNWVQPQCPWTQELINKMWYIYTMEYYSDIKNKVIMKFPGKWIKLEKK